MIMKESRSAIDRGSSDPQEWHAKEPKVEFQAARKFTIHDGGFNRTYFESVNKHFSIGTSMTQHLAIVYSTS